ncbi:4'-phosphopantetheinyl transferase family protein [Flavobacterium sp. WC2509]|uniref:4'-phosphopantetheinyl transferase family protein n=1 Tax=Flavobacterium sp. WC2509 TaxID=3461406 RepID=UPI0040447481
MQIAKLYISYLNIRESEFPTKEYSLNTDDIIIYKIYLPNFIDLKLDLLKFLNLKENIRAERFHKELDRNRFIIYRSILKFILAAYTKSDIKNIFLAYHSNKKPYLTSHPWLFFNISHSEDFAFIAISRKKIGIDIEYMAEDFNFTNLLPDVFDDKEILAIQNAVDKKQAFYTSWTRKEAFVKALGKGIDEDFKYIPCLDGMHTLDSIELKNTEDWQVYSFDFADHYLGAIAIEGVSTISKDLILCSVPNTLNSLLEMIQIKNY